LCILLVYIYIIFEYVIEPYRLTETSNFLTTLANISLLGNPLLHGFIHLHSHL
jgi:hypothetical protein